jgi:hypothetical protein
MPRIIQFLHTAVEATPLKDSDIEIPWNNHKKHRRKFILSEGTYVNGDNVKEDCLTFWGEWEAQSKIEKLHNTKKNLPTLLNRPFLDTSASNRTHNTDPYVFGENFRYIVCQQGFFKILRNLEPFSLILFGSSIDNKFCLDTVFLVSEDIVKYNFNNIETVFNQRNQYYYASVNPLYDDTKFNDKVEEEDTCRIKSGKEYAFYKGVNYKEKDNYEGIYSFVPCRKYNANKKSDFLFKQPIIELDFITGSKTQGINACNGRDFSKKEIIHYWRKISDQVENLGLLRGVNFKTPTLKR